MKKRGNLPKSNKGKLFSNMKSPFTNSFKNKKIKFNSRLFQKNKKTSAEIEQEIDTFFENTEKKKPAKNKIDKKSKYTPKTNSKDISIKEKIKIEEFVDKAGGKSNKSKHTVDEIKTSDKTPGTDSTHKTSSTVVTDTQPITTNTTKTSEKKYTQVLANANQNEQQTIMAPNQVQIKHEDEEFFETKNITTMKNNPVLDQSFIKLQMDTNTQLIEEKTGFGWKGMGSRRIILDNYKNEYRYEVIEPQLEDTEIALKDKLIYLFRTRADFDAFNMYEEEKMKYLEESLHKIIKENHLKLDEESKDRIFYHIFRDFLGYDKIDILMHDDGIEDISCDGHGIPIFIFHKTYESITSNIVFDDSDALDSFVVKLSQICGKQISIYEPVVDGKLSDGSRLQTTLARTITQHSTFTIRRFRDDPLTPIDLIANNTMSVHMAAYFWMAIEKNASILFCGGTATGKTTMLNALSLFLPSAYKIVSIEDTREINLPHKNWVAGTTRTGFSASEKNKTRKDIDMFDLVRVALRQRPRAIIVGEVRGREAYTLFQAMTTGHLSYSTVHAGNLHSLIQRLENPPISLPRTLLTSLDLVVFLNNLTIKGKPVRRITNVTEIIKLDPETNRLVIMTPFRWVSEIDDRFETNDESNILGEIKQQNGWTTKELNDELNNRMVVLEWMKKNNLRSYEQVGKIVSEYHKNPESVFKKVKEDAL